MPVYDMVCKTTSCGEQFEAYVPKIGELAPCVKCGGETERIWSITKRPAANGYPYVTRNIRKDGKPVTVESPAHEARLCKEHGVTKRDDAAFLTKTYEGLDFRTGKQRYKEGNGVGTPGCWV